MAAMGAENAKYCKKLRRRKPSNRHRNRGYAITEMEHLTDQQFKQMFRVDRPAFYFLVDEIDKILPPRDSTKAIASSGTEITTVTRLAVTLRWLSGGNSIDLCFAWGVSRTSFYSDRGVLWPTIEALDRYFHIGLDVDDAQQLSELAEGFDVQSGGKMKGCILAIDGLVVRTRQPYKYETNNIKAYRTRKGGFGLVVLAGCDVKGKYFMATANHSGSTNDCIAWGQTALSAAIEEGKLPPQYFIIGDEAFSCTNQVLSPYPGRGIGPWPDAFNFWLSHSRQCIERSFGMLTMRFGIFWRKFVFSMDRWSLVILTCMKLHNFCIDRNVEVPTRRHEEDFEHGDVWAVVDNHDPIDDPLLRARARGNRRAVITERLKSEACLRPAHAMCNSRAYT